MVQSEHFSLLKIAQSEVEYILDSYCRYLGPEIAFAVVTPWDMANYFASQAIDREDQLREGEWSVDPDEIDPLWERHHEVDDKLTEMIDRGEIVLYLEMEAENPDQIEDFVRYLESQVVYSLTLESEEQAVEFEDDGTAKSTYFYSYAFRVRRGE